MDRAQQYAAAMLPDSWRVMGIKLHAPTLGHTLLLQRLGLPAAASALQGPLPAGTMALWLYVLSRPWQRAAASIKTWRARIWMRVVASQLRHRGSDTHALAIAAYLQEAWTGPEIWEKDTEGKTLSAPLMQSLKLLLMAKLGLSEEAALNTSVRVALWDSAALGESSGNMEWVDESLEAAIAAAMDANQSAAPVAAS